MRWLPPKSFTETPDCSFWKAEIPSPRGKEATAVARARFLVKSLLSGSSSRRDCFPPLSIVHTARSSSELDTRCRLPRTALLAASSEGNNWTFTCTPTLLQMTCLPTDIAVHAHQTTRSASLSPGSAPAATAPAGRARSAGHQLQPCCTIECVPSLCPHTSASAGPSGDSVGSSSCPGLPCTHRAIRLRAVHAGPASRVRVCVGSRPQSGGPGPRTTQLRSRLGAQTEPRPELRGRPPWREGLLPCGGS